MTLDHLEFLIVGGGAMGSILAAHLARSGHRVALLVRDESGRRAGRREVRIAGLADFSVSVPTTADPTALRSADVLIVATKAIATLAMLERLRHLQVGAALSVQNGIMKDELLANVFGRSAVLGAVADLSGERLPSGEVLFTRNVNLLMGEFDNGETRRAAKIVAALESSGLRARAVPDIETLSWSKFAAWVGTAAAAVTTRVPTWQFQSDPDSARVIVRIVREVGQLANAAGVSLSDGAVLPVRTLCDSNERQARDVVMQMGAELRVKAPAHRISLAQDLEAGRPLELEETLGYAVRRGLELKVPLPLVEAFHALTCAIDRFRFARPTDQTEHPPRH